MSPDLKLKIADPMLDYFNLLDPELAALQIRVTDILTVLREGAQAEEGGRDEPLALPNLPPPQPQMEISASDLPTLIRQVAELNTASQQRLAAAQADVVRLEQALPQRRATLMRLAQREDAKEVELDPELLSIELLDQRVAAINSIR
jgi:hypothetical protein